MKEATKEQVEIDFYSDRCKTCTHWKVGEGLTHWGNCTEPEIKKFLVCIIPDYFGCLWYQPTMSEKLRKFQIILPEPEKEPQ